MMYIICNKFGEPKEGLDKVSEGQCTKVKDFDLQDREGTTVSGYLLVVDCAVHYAVGDGTSSPAPVEDPQTPYFDTKSKPYSD